MIKEFNLSEKIEQLFNQWKTSWKYLEKHGLRDAEWHGNCVFLNWSNVDFERELDKIHREFIKRLKEEALKDSRYINEANMVSINCLFTQIKKLAGEEISK